MWKAALAFTAALMLPAAACAQPPVWVVRDADSELVLFGSIHVLPPGLNWTTPALQGALRDADDIWFEVPMDAASEQQVAQLAATHGVLPPDKSLSALLGPKGAADLAAAADRYGASMAVLDRLQPWLAEVALASAVYARAGGDSASGVEKTLAAAAPPTAARRAFETPAEQIALFDGAPMAEQIASLEETLRDLRDDPDQYNQLVAAWMAGDMAALGREALDPLKDASPALFDRLVSQRNTRWVQVLKTRMAGKGRTVVVVGVGHLIGPGGVPAKLRALGYSVTGP
jgi:uncharacterized protein YbaP (TraB family)